MSILRTDLFLGKLKFPAGISDWLWQLLNMIRRKRPDSSLAGVHRSATTALIQNSPVI